MKLGKKEESIRFYLHALAFADFNDNQVIVDIIRKDVKDFGIEVYFGGLINDL